MSTWRKYTLQLREALYAANPTHAQLHEAIWCVGLDRVEEDKQRVETFVDNPDLWIRGKAINVLVGWFGDPKWVPKAIDMLDDPDVASSALGALLHHVRDFPEKKELLAHAATRVLKWREAGEDWEYKGRDIVRLNGEAITDLVAQLDAISRAG